MTVTSCLLAIGLCGCAVELGSDVEPPSVGAAQVRAKPFRVDVGYLFENGADVQPTVYASMALPTVAADAAATECPQLSPETKILANGTDCTYVHRGGQLEDKWSGCHDTAYASAEIQLGPVELAVSDESGTAVVQFELTMPTVSSPADGHVAAGSQIRVELPRLTGVADTAAFKARLFTPGTGPDQYPEPASTSLNVKRDGNALLIDIPSDAVEGSWSLYISHPDESPCMDLPATRCDFASCQVTYCHGPSFFRPLPIVIARS